MTVDPKTIPAEAERWKAARDACEQQYQAVVENYSKECDRSDTLRAENERLREALEKIAYDSINCTPFAVARAALTRTDRRYNVAERLFGDD